MTKLYILLIAIFLAIITAKNPEINTYSNYNAQDQEGLQYLEKQHMEKFRRDVGPDHGATYLYFDGFYYGLQIYQNVTHRNECLAFLPDAHDDLVDIYYAFKNCTHDTDFIDLIRYALNKTDHILSRIQDTQDDCKVFKSEVRQVNKQVYNYLHNQSLMHILNHIRQNRDIIKQKYQNYVNDLNNKDWTQAGYDQGDLINFALLWEYQPPQTKSIDSVDIISHLDFHNFNLRNQ